MANNVSNNNNYYCT